MRKQNDSEQFTNITKSQSILVNLLNLKKSNYFHQIHRLDVRLTGFGFCPSSHLPSLDLILFTVRDRILISPFSLLLQKNISVFIPASRVIYAKKKMPMSARRVNFMKIMARSFLMRESFLREREMSKGIKTLGQVSGWKLFYSLNRVRKPTHFQQCKYEPVTRLKSSYKLWFNKRKSLTHTPNMDLHTLTFTCIYGHSSMSGETKKGYKTDVIGSKDKKKNFRITAVNT
nr:uncharacterized protein LOC121126991 isoform X2 [Lepeophtheirus salmonis]